MSFEAMVRDLSVVDAAGVKKFPLLGISARLRDFDRLCRAAIRKRVKRGSCFTAVSLKDGRRKRGSPMGQCEADAPLLSIDLA